MQKKPHVAKGIEHSPKKISRTNSAFRRQEKWSGLMFISPMFLGYFVFLFGPIVASIILSFSDWSLRSELNFIGLSNYRKAVSHDPYFWDTVYNTLYFTVGFVPLTIVTALILALLLNKSLPGMGIFRTAIFSPVIVSIVVWAIVWKYMLQPDHGYINQMLKLFNLPTKAWLFDFTWTMPAVIVITMLKIVGLKMIIILAALQGVPSMYYEAAKIDGATRWKQLIHVTIPLISPALLLVSILTMITSLKVFGNIYVLTGGGPGSSTYVFVYYIFLQAFQSYDFGYASAIAFILFVIILGLTVVQWITRKRWVHHEQ